MQKIGVTVDIVCLRPMLKPAEIALIRRGRPPFEGKWALPGGFVEVNEDLETAARRELMEETQLAPETLEQLYCFGSLDRDPRGRTISIVYWALIDTSQIGIAGDDAAELQWFPIHALPCLAFDHAEIISKARLKLNL
jgi:8-oxo-dGTP diphosphatase